MRKLSVVVKAPGPLRVERLSDGRRHLVRSLVLSIGGEDLRIPSGFVTDFSSWPRFLSFVLGFVAIGLALFGAPTYSIVAVVAILLLSLGPRFSRTDVAGVAHDFLFQLGKWGYDGRKVGFVEANRVWYAVARAGQDGASAGFFWAWAGRIGLFLGSWPVWLRYRLSDLGP